MKRLEDKIIIVTGGSGLIGSEIVKNIRKEGGIAINADLEVKTNIKEGTVRCDVTDETSIQQAVDLVTAGQGRIDGLVNNAYPRTKDWGLAFEQIPSDSLRKNVDMQMNAYILFCQKVLEVMKRQQSGSIVNIASIYGAVGPDFTVYEGTDLTSPAAYSAIKGGIINFTRYLASYAGGHQVRVNCVSPGGVFDHQPEAFVKNYEKKVPLNRMARPEDIAPAVSFLLSEDAAYITGQNLMVDGGWTCI